MERFLKDMLKGNSGLIFKIIYFLIDKIVHISGVSCNFGSICTLRSGQGEHNSLLKHIICGPSSFLEIYSTCGYQESPYCGPLLPLPNGNLVLIDQLFPVPPHYSSWPLLTTILFTTSLRLTFLDSI